MTAIYVKTEKCTLCGHELAPTPERAFVENGKYYCKPTCFMHRNDNKKKLEKKEKCASLKKRTLVYKDGKLFGEYASRKEAAEACGLTQNTIGKSMRTGKPAGGFVFKRKEKEQCEKD